MVGFLFSCFEIAVISSNKNKLERLSSDGDKRAARLLRLTKLPSKFLATIQVGNTLAGFLASAFAAGSIASRLTNWFVGRGARASAQEANTIAVVLVTVALSYFSIVLGELIPKRIAMKYSEKISLAASGVIFAVSLVFAPVVFVLSASANAVLRLFKIYPDAPEDEVTEEEIRMMVDAGSDSGAIEEDEKDIIHNLFEFDDLTAAEVMTHRTEIISLWQDGDWDDWNKVISENRLAFFPIFGEDQDDVVGVLNSKDYFRLFDKGRDSVMQNAVRPAQFVPESVKADRLFRNMKKSRNHFAVVLDEYGGVSGVVTMNDLLEELVGDLDDDQTAPPERPEIECLGEGVWRVSGTAPLVDVAERLGAHLPSDEYDTFSAMVFGMLGTVPEDGQTPELFAHGLLVRVTEIRDHRLESAEVTFATESGRDG
jgi:putative hemolysin